MIFIDRLVLLLHPTIWRKRATWIREFWVVRLFLFCSVDATHLFEVYIKNRSILLVGVENLLSDVSCAVASPKNTIEHSEHNEHNEHGQHQKRKCNAQQQQ